MANRKLKRKSYFQKLQDRRWQQRRLEILERDHFCCQYPGCDNTVSMLDVHHRAYLRNRDPWEYPDFCLITFCQAHHEVEQNRMEQAHLAIARNPVLIEYCIEHGREEVARIIQTSPVPKSAEKIMDREAANAFFAAMRESMAASV